jgi:hypothetical protein
LPLLALALTVEISQRANSVAFGLKNMAGMRGGQGIKLSSIQSPEKLRSVEQVSLVIVTTPKWQAWLISPTATAMSLVLDALVYVVAWTHVLLAPYTKVEESFNLHAIHDILLYGGHREAIQKVCSDPSESLSSSISLPPPSS